MNDEELITVLREQRGKVPMTVPVEQVISRGRAVRARRRVPGVAASLAAAAAVAAAVSVALAGHPASGPGARLAAWTVTRQTDGSIQVTVRELRDPAGLQRTLRADGVPVSVIFNGQQNPACRGYPFNGSLGSRVAVDVFASGHDAMVIYPSALPSGAGLLITTNLSRHDGPRSSFPLAVSWVQASPQCTGS